jgi:hypothetical protein
MADLDESRRQDVHQETADELDGGHGHHLLHISVG